MKYVRTKNSIREIINDYGNCCSVKSNHRKTIGGFTIIYGLSFAPRADIVEELCDAFVIFYNKSKHKISVLKSMATARLYYKRDKRYNGNYVDKIYGAIWTDKGLIYVAKMNDKGELELL